METERNALVRYAVQDRAFAIIIDNPPVNVLSRHVRRGLQTAVDAAERAIADGTADRVVLTGAGRAFVAGADAREFDLPLAEPHLPDIIARLSRLPAIAAINGAALGGGFELALGCRVRIAAPGALIGLPEVTLGVVPGAGGTQRLPRLIGMAAALPLIAEGRTLRAPDALSLGAIDRIADDPVATALACDPAWLVRPPLADLPAPAPDPAAITAARAHAARRQKGHIAPLHAIDLIERSASKSFAEGMAAERASFLDLRAGPQSLALRHVFFAERSAGQPPKSASPPAPVNTALVAGGGTMGAAITYALVTADLHVTVLEQDSAAEARARGNLARLFDDAVRLGKLTEAAAAQRQSERLAFVHGAADLPPVDIAIEAIFEDLAAKQALFSRLGSALPPTTLLATNTSYLDVNAIAAGLPNPARFLGLHFFAPAHVMRLLEVIRTDDTDDATLAAAFGLARRLGKIAVAAGVCDGFIGNRILKRYRTTGERLLLVGALPWQIDAALEAFGMAMGPYAAQDLSGLDIAHANLVRQRATTPAPSEILDTMVVQLRRLGRKSGSGWYDYSDGRARPSPVVRDLIEAAACDAGIQRRNLATEEIALRMVLAIIAEALDILADGIAARPKDIDLVMIHGYGFPRWSGGPMHLADDWGLYKVRNELAALADEDPEFWPMPPLLLRLVDERRHLSDMNGIL